MLIAGVELDLHLFWRNRRETTITAGLALGTPVLLGAVAALTVVHAPGWIGQQGQPWQSCLASAWLAPSRRCRS